MIWRNRSTLYLLCLLAMTAFTGVKITGVKITDAKGWTMLFNGKDLRGWNSYLGPESGTDSNGKKLSDQPVGLNKDPRKVFTVVSDNGEKGIRISGEGVGAISTQKEFEDYHLQLQFKGGALQWGNKKKRKKDSGLLYHSVGTYGADNKAWMRSQEFEREEGNGGDYGGCA